MFMLMSGFQMAVQIVHVMVVVVMLLIQDHIKIAAVNTALHNPADPDFKAAFLFSDSFQNLPKDRFVGTKVQKSGDNHIAADTAAAFQV